MITDRSSLRVATASLAALAVGAAAQSASGYCRTRTCEFTLEEGCARDQVTGCSTVGEAAAWRAPCVSFAVQRDGSATQGIPARTIVGLMEAGFAAWSDVACGGGLTPALSAVARGQSECDAVEYNCRSEDNVNLVTFRDEGTLGLDRTTIALTTVIANLNTGEILDADIELNSLHHEFSVGPPPRRSNATDLRVVINHEIGHFLGLSHSADDGALMNPLYGDEPLPQADDALGMCDLLVQDAANPSCSGIEPLEVDAACVGVETDNCPVRSELTTLASDGGCGPCSLSGGAGPSNYAYGLGGMLGLLGTLLLRRRAAR